MRIAEKGECLMNMLHAHGDGDVIHLIYEEVILHGILDTLKIIPFLFITYLIVELIDHKASFSVKDLSRRAGKLGPLCGGLLGAVPQCGISAAAADLYRCRAISLGTMVAIFLSTSDEMLPIMISGKVSIGYVFAILGYKATVGILVGFIIDLLIKKKESKAEAVTEAPCECGHCCNHGILASTFGHTLTVGCFVLISTLLINLLVVLVGDETIKAILYDKPFVGHLIAALIGLIPNCAVSVALTNLSVDGFITVGTMISGLSSGAGVGLLVLFRVNKSMKENFLTMGILVASGTIFGMIADLLNFSALM
jgi:hypothetical protein